ncbi:ABC transporter ATP-binding protein [Ignavigranum ruoffiae]|uniref:Putative ABC transport system ATP-binding protein n=1 Tax=Ignavigranum ruoffiae TaxID=89093 RepID=A0A1H9CRN6_9LACT|nr:ABC transporter ATP-binding protein [Ignavigranum ruoffiae]SEQ03890.1 putative ABC transport system ATP-binding protein [Ignavigranum ruoffiae]
MTLLEVNHLKKVYGDQHSVQTEALSKVSFTVNQGEFVAIMGESGSGKSTLLNIIASLDHATAGSVILNGRNLSKIKAKDLARFRREELGFVFQQFNLLNSFSNRDNVLLPLVLSGVNQSEMNQQLMSLVNLLGLADILDKYPYQISGGQQQRVAIARAMISQPSLLLADEPTGALDSKSSQVILDLFSQLQKAGQTILMVTHSLTAAAYADRVLFIKDGIVYNEIYKGGESQRQFFNRINQSLEVISAGEAHE